MTQYQYVNAAACIHPVLRRLANQTGYDLSPTDMRMLAYLHLVDSPVYCSAFDEKLGVNKRHSREHLASLVYHGLVDPVDRRYSISVSGRALLQKLDHMLGSIRPQKSA